jgi:hypothetical protein
VKARVQARTTAYGLAEANRALQDMKRSQLKGTPVLVLAGTEN